MFLLTSISFQKSLVLTKIFVKANTCSSVAGVRSRTVLWEIIPSDNTAHVIRNYKSPNALQNIQHASGNESCHQDLHCFNRVNVFLSFCNDGHAQVEKWKTTN